MPQCKTKKLNENNEKRTIYVKRKKRKCVFTARLSSATYQSTTYKTLFVVVIVMIIIYTHDTHQVSVVSRSSRRMRRNDLGFGNFMQYAGSSMVGIIV